LKKKINRQQFLKEKFNKWEEILKKYLPEKEYKLHFEDILNQLKDLLG